MRRLQWTVRLWRPGLAVLAAALLAPAWASGNSPIAVTNTADGGPGSLRQAIADANANRGSTIVFHIPVSDPGFNGSWFTIKPFTQLTTVTANGTTIDGGSQTLFTGDTNPAGPEVEVNGSMAPPSNGLVFASSNDNVNGVDVDGFHGNGSNQGGVGVEFNGASNTITGSYLGIDPTGTFAVPNDQAGITVDPNAGSGTRIGGLAPAERNVISGNRHYGVLVLVGDDGTLVEGNFVGTNLAGNAAVPNGGNPNSGDAGIHLQSNDNTITGNLISGNEGQSGIFCGPSPGGQSNVIEGNLIGTDASGTAAVANVKGVAIARGDTATIGGTSPAERNLISGNRVNGIEISGATVSVVGNYIGTDLTGTAALPNGTNGGGGITVFGFGGPANVTIGGTSPGSGNLISGNASDGVSVQGDQPSTFTVDALIEGNLIGTNAAGLAAVPNRFSGVELSGHEAQAVVGGTGASARNVISGNGNGVAIDDGASNELVEGNYIGTDLTGTAPIANTWGVSIQSYGPTATGNAVVGNVVSGNQGYGVFVGHGATGTSIRGNLIGTDASGTTALGNGFTPNDCCGGGVRVNDGGANVTIGGASASDRNVISGNKIGVGVIGANHVLIQGNYIGTDITGTNSVPNAPGREAGIRFFSQVTASTILGNVISGNGSAGVGLTSDPGTFTSGNTLAGNLIGTAADGTSPLPNAGPGIAILNDGATQNLIGGSASGAGNVIAYNHGPGIGAFAGVENTFSRNSIFSNDGLGIDLGGDFVTQNNCCGHTGPNDFENFPVFTSAVTSSGKLFVRGTLDTSSPQSATVEIFASAVPVPGADPSGYGEGQTFLGAVTPSADGSFRITVPAPSPGAVISATATDGAGNTSEFAKDFVSLPLPTSADQCKHGGWQAYGIFENQGDCVSYAATGGKNPPSG